MGKLTVPLQYEYLCKACVGVLDTLQCTHGCH